MDTRQDIKEKSIKGRFRVSRKLTSKDGLVNTQGGGLDGNNPDVSGDFVTNCGDNKGFAIKMNPLLCFTKSYKQTQSLYSFKTVENDAATEAL